MSQLFFLSLMSWVIIWNRGNGFCLRKIQVTSFPALSKQSRKKGSFYSICEADETLEIHTIGSDPDLLAQAELLKQQKNGRFPDDPVKIKCAQAHSGGGQMC
jgi:hypothetical protein